MTTAPLPVTILKPRLSATPSTASWRKPEMMRASLGSATRHIARNSRTNRTSTTTTATPMTANGLTAVPPSRGSPSSGGSDVDGAGRVVLDDHYASVLGNRLVAVHGMGEERLRAASDGDDHLAGLARADGAGDTADLTDHVPNRS